MTIMFSPDGHYLAAGQGNGAVHLWDLKPETARRAESVPLTTADGLTIPEILKRNAQVMQNLQTMQITVTTTMRQSTPPNGDATVEGSPVTATYIYSAADSQPSMPPTLALVWTDAIEQNALFIPPAGLLPLDGNFARMAEYEGVKAVDGHDYHVISFGVRPPEFFSRAPYLQGWFASPATTITGTAWIGVEDLRTNRLAYTIVIRTPWTDQEFNYTTHIGGYNEFVRIPPTTQ